MENSPEDQKIENNAPQQPPQIKSCTAADGVKWISHSFSLFSKNPSIWIVMLIIYIGISFLLTKIPLLVFLSTLLGPVFSAGFVSAARGVDQNQALEIDHLFNGFKQQFKTLFRLGIIYFAINIVIIAIVTVLLDSFVESDALDKIGNATTQQELERILTESPELLAGLMKALMIGLILSIPLIMASWFAPSLIMFNQMTALKAMSLSITACNKNMVAFLVYGALMIPLMILAVLPLGLGLLVIVPVVFISQYSSYKTIFSESEPKNDEGVFIV